MTLDLSAQELDLLLKTLDATPSRGIETQRMVVGLADKLAAALVAASPPLTPPAPTG